ncbi:MAG: hypothetical protein PF489_07140 [Salinivirgaceae bacterium]|nr:hypothetical protein [Salinivirgaceae bacterium]
MKNDSGGIAYHAIMACLIMVVKDHYKTTRVHSCPQFHNGSTPPESYVRIRFFFYRYVIPLGLRGLITNTASRTKFSHPWYENQWPRRHR